MSLLIPWVDNVPLVVTITIRIQSALCYQQFVDARAITYQNGSWSVHEFAQIMTPPSRNILPIVEYSVRVGPVLIAAGLAILLAASVIQNLPVATGYALVAMGATHSTIGRYRGVPALRCMLLLNFFTYACLYVLLLCAVCDLVSRKAGTGVGLAQPLDIGISALVMVLVARRCLSEIVGGGDAQAR